MQAAKKRSVYASSCPVKAVGKRFGCPVTLASSFAAQRPPRARSPATGKGARPKFFRPFMRRGHDKTPARHGRAGAIDRDDQAASGSGATGSGTTDASPSLGWPGVSSSGAAAWAAGSA